MQAQGNHDLALPQRQRVGQRALDTLHQQAVIVLQQADLRGHLQRHLTGELEVVQLLFKTVAVGGHIVGALGVHGVAALGGAGFQLLQRGAAHLGQPLFAGQDIHGQLLEVLGVHVVEVVEEADVLEQLDLIALQRRGDGVDVDLHLVVLGLHVAHGLFGVPEQAPQPLGLFGAIAEALDFVDQLDQHFAHFAGVVGAHGGKRAVAEIGDLFLRVGPVEQHVVGVVQVDLLGEFLDGPAVGLAEHGGVHLRRGFGRRHGSGFQLLDGFLHHHLVAGHGGFQGEGGGLVLILCHDA